MSWTRVYAVTESGPQRLSLPRKGHDVHDVFDDLPLGIYEAFRTFFGDRFLHLDRHLERAERSMQAVAIHLPLDRAAVKKSLNAAAGEWAPRDARIRLDVLEGVPRSLGTDRRVLIALSELVPVPARILEEGARLGIAAGKWRARPQVKQAAWVIERRGTGPGDHGLFEYVLLDPQQRILECTSSNFFAVRGGRLVTADEGVLEGITRFVILKVARELEIPVDFARVPLKQLPLLEEAFLTSSSRGPVPIAAIDDVPIGSLDRPVFQRLRAGYDSYVRRHARPADA